MNIIPTVLERNGNNEYAFDLYSRLLKDRVVFLTGEINDSIANIVIGQLLYLDSISNEDIYLYINSPGGSITSGMAIYDTMNYIKSNVSTICVGIAASMAAIILASGEIGKRKALPNSEVMIHQPLGGAEGQASDIKIAAERIIKMRKKLNKILAEKTNKNINIIKRDTERDFYLDSHEAKKYGLIDEII